jgi:hypothetical protein
MNKQALRFIDKLSGNPPVIMFDAAIERRRTLGADLLLGNVKEVEGKPVDPKKEYLMKLPVRREMDHKMRLKNAYKKAGKVGLITYLRPFIKPEKFGEVQVYIMKSLR